MGYRESREYAADAEAICEAVARANKRFVETKTLEAAELPDTPSHAPALHPPADFGDKCHPRIGTSRRASR